jgi:hypothetical protein
LLNHHRADDSFNFLANSNKSHTAPAVLQHHFPGDLLRGKKSPKLTQRRACGAAKNRKKQKNNLTQSRQDAKNHK